MTAQTKSASDSTAERAAIGATAISPWRRFYWCVRRELWENRSIYVVPAGVAVLIVIASAISLFPIAARLGATELDPMAQHAVIEEPFIFASALLMLAQMAVSVFYTVDALYGERRDRSVLFWKSMPVSDTTTVLAKLSIPLVVLPVVTFVFTLAAQVFMLLFALMGGGAGLVGHIGVLEMWWSELFHFVAFHGLWWAPFWGWFLLASALARRAPLIWAVLPPLVIGFAEKIAFGSSHFANWVLFRFLGETSGNSHQTVGMSTRMLMGNGVVGFVTDIHLWTGFLMCAVCVALAVYLRRQRGPV